MTVRVHYHIPGISREGMKQFSEKIGGSTVLATTINYATPTEIFAKRQMDIVGGLFGSLASLIVIVVIGSKIKKASSGPSFAPRSELGKMGKVHCQKDSYCLVEQK